ncbi:carboxyl transferase domain-containing protein [Mycolicibacterium vaccae]|uniref:ATP-binding protein n=1 Tax=Mycolicibacterium vaccae TaxID=1810 RepID=UPI0007DDC3BC|nr:carboxyl transferase domain-containing protein [Mycolicibacterium vaccae]ANI38164.1 carbamoyl-phosphate synthase subunit L [Mycolicibacterium vaccae 95051]
MAIANRGEAAMRFLNAAGEYRIERDVPLETVAIYTDADADSWFVREADHAVNLGPTMSVDPATGARRHTYLDVTALEAALSACGADAVWPGWGFVAENPDFVRMCERIGVRFIGPSATAMDLLGSKIAAKTVAESVDVPVVPWSHGPVDTADDALNHARRIGFPVVIKAAAGGGGRGIRVVADESAIPDAFHSARAEAQSAFGDPTLFVEAQVLGGRHLEVQVAADHAGNVWTLGLRDCSVQRRRQKVLEESAPVDVGDELRATILDAARRLCRAVEYTNVGTVEFLFRPDTGDFYFLEVNTRLQVEHTVTEAVTGVDLVKLQLDLAQGRPLVGEPPTPRGHAVEVRLNAEDPRRGFAPAPGRVVELRTPQGPSIRTDSGVVVGDSIAAEFDSMIAKVIAWGRDRPEALARLRRSLARSTAVIEGGTTNRRFLMALLDNADIRARHVDTTWLDRALEAGVLLDSPDAAAAMVIAAAEAHRQDRADALDQFVGKAVHGRLDDIDDATAPIDLEYEGGRRSFRVLQYSPADLSVTIDGESVVDARFEVRGTHERRLIVTGERSDGVGSTGERSDGVGSSGERSDGVEWPATVVTSGPLITVELGHSVYRIIRGHGGLIRAESQSVVAKMAVEVGQEVKPGEVLFISEAMKMESPVMASFPGRVTEIIADTGTLVGAGDPILRVEAVDHSRSDDADRLSFAALVRGTGTAPVADADIVTRLVLGQDLGDDVVSAARLSFDEGLRVLRTIADRMALFVDAPAGDGSSHQGAPHLSVRPDLLLFAVRSPDRIHDVAPAEFVARLTTMLHHYGVDQISQGPHLTEALYSIWRAESRLDRVAELAATLLQNWLTLDPDTVQSPELVGVLDDLIASTEGAHPAVADLGRAVRHRLVEYPVLTALRADDDRTAERLVGAATPESMAGLLRLPAPLDRYLVAAIETGDEKGAFALEALVRRTHRHRELDAVTPLACRPGVIGLRTARFENGESVAVVAVSGRSADLRDMLSVAANAVGQSDGAVEIELFLSDVPGADDLDAQVETTLADLAGAGRVAVTATWWLPGTGLEVRSQQHRTLVGAAGRFAAGDHPPGMHPATADRLELWRFAEFDITVLDAPEGIHLLKVVAKENRIDERLIAMLEVFDLDGQASTYARLKSQLSQSAIAIRQARVVLRDPSASLSNRIVIYAEPVWPMSDTQLQAVIADLLPLTRGLGLEKVIGSVHTVNEVTGERTDEVIHITTPPTVGVMIGRTKPSKSRIRPMSDYRRRVVALQRRGLVYPYEIVELLVGTGATHTELPTGEFVEYDFVAARFDAVDRPRGQNTARVVTGVIDSRPDGADTSIRRVLILNEPSRDLASLAEPECRRMIAAMDLAAELGVPVEWYAVSSGARIAMDSGTENLDWTAAVLRRIVEFTQAGGEINVVVVGVNVGAQSYFDAEATMLMHTSGVLIMVGRSAMVLTGKQALEFSGGVAAEDNAGIGGYRRIAGPNGQAQFWVPDVESACALLFRHYESSQSHGAQRPTTDPADRDISSSPHLGGTGSFETVGDIFSQRHNPDRKRPFDIRSVMSAVRDQDAPPLERWKGWQDAENVVAWDTRLGGFAVSLVGVESRNLRRRLPRPADGPDSWTAGTLFPQSSKKLARVINGASGRRPLVILANLSGFDGSPESMRKLQLEYGAEIGRAIVNFRGPIVFSVISRYHGGAYVVFSKSLNPNMEVSAVEGSRASVIGGAPAAAVVFTREVRARVRQDPDVILLEKRLADAAPGDRALLQHELHQLTSKLTTEVQTAVAREFDDIHTVERALRVGSIDHIVTPSDLRPYLIGAVTRGLRKTNSHTSEGTRHA